MADLTILYKIDSTDTMRMWWIEQQLDSYRMVSGVVGSNNLVASEWTKAQATNIGRANQRNSVEQANFEVQAAYAKKRKEGYVDDIEQAYKKEKRFFEPMLAKKYEEYIGVYHWNHPLYCQPKLDGIRCLANFDRLHTRKGEDIPSCFHILRAFEDMPQNVIFDGELYNHDLKDNFNEIASLVRKTKGWEKHQDKIFSTIQYWVYDAFFVDEPNLPFSERYRRLSEMLTGRFEHIKVVRTFSAQNQTEIDNAYAIDLEQGFEGQIVRTDTPYENKRTSALLKRKEFQDAEFIILDVLEGIGNRSGMAGSLVLQLADGRTFQSNIKGGRDHYRYLLSKRDEFIGKPATIRYFHLTPDGIPRFPVATDIGRKDV